MKLKCLPIAAIIIINEWVHYGSLFTQLSPYRRCLIFLIDFHVRAVISLASIELQLVHEIVFISSLVEGKRFSQLHIDLCVCL